MHFKVRKLFKNMAVPRIYYRRCMILFGRIFLIFMLICAFLFILSLRNNIPNIKLRKKYISENIFSKMIIDSFNFEEKILNTKSYGQIKEDTIIFVVLTDGFSKEFNTFLVSLSKIRGIEDSFIIFSHYNYNQNLNRAIIGIEFCRVLQLFYPFSEQTHFGEYSDRNHDGDRNEGEKSTQENFADIRGYDRNGRKHHWWWTANHIYERLDCTKNHTGFVIFMEDDIIFTQDFIYMAIYMKNIAGSQPRCEFVSMGAHYVPDTKYSGRDIYSAKLTEWDPIIHSSVLAFDITTWNILAAHYELYCDLNDVSWSRTLYHISSHRMDSLKFKVLSSIAPRAFKVTPCRWFCYLNTDVDKLSEFENANEENWFPPYLELYVETDDINRGDSEVSKPSVANSYERALCHSMSTNKMKKVIMALNN